MRLIVCVLAVALLSTPARAQPALTPPSSVMTIVPGAPLVGPPRLALALTPDELEILEEGPVSDGRHVGGVALAYVLGFGTGQLVEGRWGKTGWVFTLGEGLAIAGMVSGLAGAGTACGEVCRTEPGDARLVIASLVAFMGLRVWEVADAAIAPLHQNARYRAVAARIGLREPLAQVAPFVAPAARGDGALAGLAVRF